MKGCIFFITTLLLTACMARAPYSDETMYDVASHLKDVSQAVDGEIKFGDIANLTHAQIIQQAMASDPQKLDALKPYQLQLAIQGDHAVMLLCDNDVALMEDAGCNAAFDTPYWQDPKSDTCSVRLDAQTVCPE